MPRTLLFCDLDLQSQGHWWPLKGQILAIFSFLAQFSLVESFVCDETNFKLYPVFDREPMQFF